MVQRGGWEGWVGPSGGSKDGSRGRVTPEGTEPEPKLSPSGSGRGRDTERSLRVEVEV